MHEAPDGAYDEAAEPSAEGATGANTEGATGATTDAAADGAAAIEALPLADRAPRYQAVADRLRADLERSDPARGDG